MQKAHRQNNFFHDYGRILNHNKCMQLSVITERTKLRASQVGFLISTFKGHGAFHKNVNARNDDFSFED